MKKLKDYILEAEKKGIAIGHFNISNLETLRGIFNASKNGMFSIFSTKVKMSPEAPQPKQ